MLIKRDEARTKNKNLNFYLFQHRLISYNKKLIVNKGHSWQRKIQRIKLNGDKNMKFK